MKVIGNIIELDPTKKYVMLVEEGSIDIDALDDLEFKDGRIIFVKNLKGIKIIENGENIKEARMAK